MTLGEEVGSFKGLTAATGDTVSGKLGGLDTDVLAVVGDYKNLRWGYQKEIKAKVIEYGDPDNTGRDLQGHNEVLVRSEAVIYVLVPSLDAYGVVQKAA